MMTKTVDPVLFHERLKILWELSLVDGPNITLYDELTELASRIIDAPISLVSMVTSHFQFFTSQVGLPEPVSSERRTPLSHSFCKHVAADNQPLIANDAREVDFLRENGAIADLHVIAYLGMPLRMDDDTCLGSFCVIDNQPRTWTQTEISIMQDLSQIISHEIDLRARARLDPKMQPKLEMAHHAIRQLIRSLNTSQPKETFLLHLRIARRKYSI